MFLEVLLPYLTVKTTLLVITISLLLTRWFTQKKLDLPPGPISFPILGSIPMMEMKAERTFSKWSKKYGPVMTVQLGSHRTIVLNSYEAIEQAFCKQSVFNSRYHTYFTEFACEGFGIMFLNGDETWKTQRRFGLRALSGTSLSGNTIENRILDEVNLLCEVIRSKNEKPFVLEVELMGSIANVINGITIQKRCTENGSERFHSYVTQVIEGFRKDGFYYNLLSVLPWSRVFPVVKKHLDDMRIGLNSGNSLFDEFISDHNKEFDPKHIRDFTDAFLAEHKQSTPSFENLKQLRYFLKDLFAAGTETTTSTIRWTLLFLIEYPEIQKKVHEEIDRVVGHGGKIHMGLDLPFTKAVIQEIYRIRTVTPLGVPRCASESTKLFGYDIPKNSQIIANLWAIHNDPNVWPDPERFDPKRHLDDNGNFFKSPYVIPFSVGARNCLGENLARMEVFLVTVSILQKFEILPNPDQPNPSLEGVPGVVNSAPHYPLIAKER